MSGGPLQSVKERDAARRATDEERTESPAGIWWKGLCTTLQWIVMAFVSSYVMEVLLAAALATLDRDDFADPLEASPPQQQPRPRQAATAPRVALAVGTLTCVLRMYVWTPLLHILRAAYKLASSSRRTLMQVFSTVFDDTLRAAVAWAYLNGPATLWLWNGLDKLTICAQLQPSRRLENWLQPEAGVECDQLIEARVDAAVVTAVCALSVLALYWTLTTYTYDWRLRRYLAAAKHYWPTASPRAGRGSREFVPPPM